MQVERVAVQRVEIRDTATADLDRILGLNNSSTPELNELDAAELARLHGLAEVSLVADLVADLDRHLAGFCLVLGPGEAYASLNYGWFSARYTDFAYLDRIAVAPQARRRGVAGALYAAVLARLADRFDELCLEVNVRPYNEPSLRFHRGLGCVEVGRQDTDNGRKTVSLMTLRVPSATVA